MSKKPEQPTPEQQAELFVAEYQHQYSDAISRAREAAKTTGTAAWQANYAFQRRAHEDVIRSATKAIVSVCERVTTADTNEDDEKAIRDAAKSMADERIRFEAWQYRTVYAFRRSVDDCESIVGVVVRAAQNAERESPLIYSGLAGRIGKLVGLWPAAGWDEETGIVAVNENPSAANAEAA
jgi:hypothetical protein